MSIRCFLLSTMICASFVAVSSVWAQSRAVAFAGAAVEQPCTLPVPSSVGDCWDCYSVALLEQCDGRETDDSRRACYEGANIFLEWCLDRVGEERNSRDLRIDNRDLTADLLFDIRKSLVYEFAVPTGTSPDEVSVLLRLSVGGEPRQVSLREGEFWVFDVTGNTGTLLVIIDTKDVNLRGNSQVGVVTVVKDSSTDRLRYAYAFTAPVIDSFDLNGDGDFDHSDLSEAMRLYSEGQLKHRTFRRMMSEHR